MKMDKFWNHWEFDIMFNLIMVACGVDGGECYNQYK